MGRIISIITLMDTEQSQQTLTKSLVEKLTIIAFVVGLVGGLTGGWAWQRLGGISSTSRELVVQENSAIIEVAKKVEPSVVSITSESIRQGFFGAQEVAGAGTGIILTEDGLIMTNKHVVPTGTTDVLVYTSDGKEHSGKVVARDPSNDIALVKISARRLKPIQLGDSGKVEIGQKVIAVGNALGQFQNSVTTGIISGIGRPVEAGDENGATETLQNLLQTDAAINPGNSGGPLVDLDGKLIGMNTAIAGDAENIGFAIPVNEAKPVIDSYKRTGKIVRAFLGVRFIAITREFAASRELPVSDGAYLDPKGASPVIAGGPAAKAGLKAGDIITKINNDSVDQKNSLTSLVGKYKPGDKVTLTILRDKREIKLDATLTEAE